MAAPDAQEVLGANASRLLSDKSYDSRTQAASDIENQVREALSPTPDVPRIERILECLRSSYVESSQPNRRKGGLIGLASVAIGLDKDITQFLDQLVRPVLSLFKDEDARVRYYACEALYNISKAGDDAVLLCFNDIFEGVCDLFADPDPEVKGGVQVLDRLMKEVVQTHCASKFQAAEFVPLLSKSMIAQSHFVRTNSLQWMQLLLSLPDVDMAQYMPQYLEGLFSMLGDQSREIRSLAEKCLSEIQRAANERGASARGSLPASGQPERPSERALKVTEDAAATVVRACRSQEKEPRLAALVWMHDFVGMQTIAMQTGRKPTEAWLAVLPELLGGILHCVDDPEDDIARMAVDQHSSLLEMVQILSSGVPAGVLVDRLVQAMQAKSSMVVQTACLQWVCMLLSRSPEQLLKRGTLHSVLTPIFETLLHPEDEVVVAALRVLAQIMEGRTAEEDVLPHADQEDLFAMVTQRLLRLFVSDRKMLETRGRLMIRQLCEHLDARRFFITVARAIRLEVGDPEFTQQLVQTFNWILLTAKETKNLREELFVTPPLIDIRGVTSQGSQELVFLELLEPWFHNPVSALALCLWSQQYVLATELTSRLATIEPTLDFLKQLDQLVHLLESPMFSRLRLRLLEPRRHPALIKCLLQISMLLPQAGAFRILRERISVVQSGLLLEAAVSVDNSAQDGNKGGMTWWSSASKERSLRTDASASDNGMAALLERFDAVVVAQ